MVVLDTKSLIKKFHKFFEDTKMSQIRRLLSEGSDFFPLCFFELSEFDIELGDALLANPEDILRIIQSTLDDFSENSSQKSMKVRIISLPVTEKTMIRDVRSSHIGKLILIEGLVRRKTDVRPRLTHIEYLCTNPSCSYSENRLKIVQLEDKAKVLKMCPKCKSGVELVKKVLVDSQNLVLEEITEQLKNTSDQPKRINVLLKEDLVSPFKDSKTNPGANIYVVGIVREIPLTTKTGAESINYEIILDGNFVDLSEEDFSEIKISKEEEEKIINLSQKPDSLAVLVDNFAPSIYGYNKVKEAIILQLFSGCGGTKGDGIKTRGDIHVLLLGDPGAAKSQLLKASTKIAPRSSFVSGKSASGVGLTATVVKDELTKGWALEAGAIVLASGGLCAIDELDKMSDDDTSAMHEALEQQTISIAKANIRATLKCQTTVLGAANPKFGRFDPSGDIAKQINFPPALISRFDLIFILRDIPNKKKDDLIANHILMAHMDKKRTIPKISTDFLKKYIAFAKQRKPVLTKEAIDKIREFYVKIRNSSSGDDGELKSVPITARQLEAIVRLAEAHAKIKLDTKVREEYAQKAIDLLLYCLQEVGIDPKTGELDIDRITSGVTASTRNLYKMVQIILDKLEAENPDIKHEDIIEEATNKKISKIEVDKVLFKLKQEGIIFEPRRNIYKKLS